MNCFGYHWLPLYTQKHWDILFLNIIFVYYVQQKKTSNRSLEQHEGKQMLIGFFLFLDKLSLQVSTESDWIVWYIDYPD